MFAALLTTFILKANSLHFLFAMQFFKFYNRWASS